MSLINKMLQDLEERHSGTGVAGTLGQPRAVPAQRRLHPAWWLVLALILLLTGLVSWFVGRQTAEPARLQSTVPQLMLKLEPRLAAVQAPALAEPDIQSVPEPISSITPATSIPFETDGRDKEANSVSTPAATSLETANAASQTRTELTAALPPVQAPHPAPVSTASAAQGVTVAPNRPTSEPAKRLLSPAALSVSKKVAASPEATNGAEFQIPGNVAKQIKEPTPPQRAENEYRRATILAQQGKNSEAIASLEQALALDPQHVVARQTLVGLLLEGKRQDEAVRRLQEGLNFDRSQPALAMMLARLQIEKNALRPAIDTLQRSLPYAGERADYHAFLAALFQRDGRHKDTIETYLIALRKSPQNGLWWMGLGISLQAEERLAEARDAFLRAKASNTLSPDLTAFVEQKLAQLR